MDINEIYSGNYLKAADLQGREVNVVIDRVERAEMQDGQIKACVYFQGKEKGLLLNKTNAMNISSLYGSNTNGWSGQPLTLGTSWVDFQGKSVEAIRVRPRAPAMNGGAVDPQAPPGHQPQQQAEPQSAPAHPDLDDEVPF